MPPKSDPYATPRARAADLLIIFVALLAILFAICTAPHRARMGDATAPPTKILTRSTTP